jgi:hypothetical protein
LSIVRTLEGQSLQEQRQAYYDRLIRQGSFSDLDDMTRRLVDVAVQRYWTGE